jgi:hypothetical protein
MQKFYRALSTLLLLICTLTAYGFAPSDDSLRIEVLLTPQMTDKINPESTLVNAVDITSDKFILLSSVNQFYLLGWGGIIPMGGTLIGNIGSFAYTSDSLLMAIRNNELCAFGSDGKLTHLYTLPSTNMGISAGKLVMYIYDRDINKAKKSMYVIAHGGQYSKLFEVSSPIYSVVEQDNSILFPNDNMIFQYNIITKELKAIASLPENDIIKSLVVDPASGRIYFSTEKMVFALNGKEITVVADKIGGTLKYLDGLIVFNPGKKLLVRLAGLDNAITAKASENKNTSSASPVTTTSQSNQVTATAPASQAVKTLTNQTIIDLKKNGLSDDLLITLINRNQVDFKLNVDSLIELSNNNISSEVIMAMKQAMKKQNLGGK